MVAPVCLSYEGLDAGGTECDLGWSGSQYLISTAAQNNLPVCKHKSLNDYKVYRHNYDQESTRLNIWKFVDGVVHTQCTICSLKFRCDITHVVESFWFLGGSSCYPAKLQRPFGLSPSILIVLPLWSRPLSFILLLTSSQSHTPLPRVIELPPPSPTPTEGPDATDSDYTASSSSSSFSFSSSSSFYATSSSSTSEKVRQLETLNRSGEGLARLETFGFPHSFSFRSLVRHNPECTEFALLFATFPLLLSLKVHDAPSPFPLFPFSSDSLKNKMFLKDLCNNKQPQHPLLMA